MIIVESLVCLRTVILPLEIISYLYVINYEIEIPILFQVVSKEPKVPKKQPTQKIEAPKKATNIKNKENIIVKKVSSVLLVKIHNI